MRSSGLIDEGDCHLPGSRLRTCVQYLDTQFGRSNYRMKTVVKYIILVGKENGKSRCGRKRKEGAFLVWETATKT